MKLKYYPLALLLMLTIFISCKEEKGINESGNKIFDVTTMSTPNGGRLKPAEKGPIRSALGVPEIDLSQFQLTITGLVDSSFSLNWEALQQWPAVYSDTILMYCVEGWEVWGNWRGILVKELLQPARPQDSAKYVLFHCVDGYTTALEVPYLEKYNSILAYEVNGKPLQKHDGFPLRLTAFGKLGYKWAKWVTKLEVISQPQKGYWEQRNYPDLANVSLSRRKYYEGEQAKPLDY